MVIRRDHVRLTLRLMFGIGMLVLILGASLTVLAADTIGLKCSPTTVPGGNVLTRIICSSAEPFTWQGSKDTYCGVIFDATSETGGTDFHAWLIEAPPGNGYYLDWDYDSATSVNFPTPSFFHCPTEPKPFAAAIWAADLCVGEDGHDSSGWLTLDANVSGSYTELWVAPSASGPWYQTQFMQPPYVLSYEHTAALVAWMGVDNEGQLWFKGGETGTGANLASMIADRAAHMDELCGN